MSKGLGSSYVEPREKSLTSTKTKKHEPKRELHLWVQIAKRKGRTSAGHFILSVCGLKRDVNRNLK